MHLFLKKTVVVIPNFRSWELDIEPNSQTFEEPVPLQPKITPSVAIKIFVGNYQTTCKKIIPMIFAKTKKNSLKNKLSKKEITFSIKWCLRKFKTKFVVSTIQIIFKGCQNYEKYLSSIIDNFPPQFRYNKRSCFWLKRRTGPFGKYWNYILVTAKILNLQTNNNRILWQIWILKMDTHPLLIWLVATYHRTPLIGQTSQATKLIWKKHKKAVTKTIRKKKQKSFLMFKIEGFN